MQKYHRKEKPCCFHSRILFYLREVIHSDHVLGEVEQKVVDGDHHVTDCRVSVCVLPLHVHGELLVGLVAIGHQVVLTHTRELVHITVKRLEVLSAPCAADAADVVVNWGCVEDSLSYEIFYVTDIGDNTLFVILYEAERSIHTVFKTIRFLPSLAWTSMTLATERARKHNHTHVSLIVASGSLRSPEKVIVISTALDGPLYWDFTLFFAHAFWLKFYCQEMGNMCWMDVWRLLQVQYNHSTSSSLQQICTGLQ